MSIDTSHETLTGEEDTRTPEEIAEDNAETAKNLNEGMFSEQALRSAGTNVNPTELVGAMDGNKVPTGESVDVARQDVGKVYRELASEAPTSGQISAEQQRVATGVEDVLGSGEVPEDGVVAARVGGEIVNNLADGTAPEQNEAILSNEGKTKVVRATVGATLLRRWIDKGSNALDGFTAATKARLLKFVQMVRERGGVEKTSNRDLADAGRFVEQSPDVQDEIATADREPQLDAQELATAWVHGDSARMEPQLQTLPNSLRGTIDAIIEARKGDDETKLIADIAEMIAESADASEYELAA